MLVDVERARLYAPSRFFGRRGFEVSAEDFVTVKEGAAELDVSEATMWSLLKQYEIERFRRPGKRETHFRRADLERMKLPIPAKALPGRPRGSSQAKKLAA